MGPGRKMRFMIHALARQSALFAVAALLSLASVSPAGATSCTMQAELQPQDRSELAAAGGRLAVAVVAQDFATLQAALLPAVAQDWDGMHAEIESAAPLVKGGQAQLRSLYLLDATSLAATADTQFFCSNTSGTLTVTLTMHALPPGRYAVVLADAVGAPMGGQIGFILAWGGPAAGWKLGGLTVRQGVLDGHDGLWWWTRARQIARADDSKADPWTAWYCFETARALLLPVDFLSSPNLEKLNTEESQLKNSPQDAFPVTVVDGPRSWKIDAVRIDMTLGKADLGVAYESTGVTDPAAQRTEAVAVLSALAKAHPGLKDQFHGLWAYAVKDGKWNPVIELPMAQIP